MEETTYTPNDDVHKHLMDRTHKCYNAIKEAQAELKDIRENLCEHPHTHMANYYFGPGRISVAEVCSVCGELMKQ